MAPLFVRSEGSHPCHLPREKGVKYHAFMRAVKIASFWNICILLACLLGIAHDTVTARVCLEYFTVHHPQIIEPQYANPTNMALIWGVLATWWVGLIGGLVLIASNELGRAPKLGYRQIALMLSKALAVIFIMSMLTLAVSWIIGNARIAGHETSALDFQHRLNTVATTHRASYLFALIAIIVLARIIVSKRRVLGA